MVNCIDGIDLENGGSDMDYKPMINSWQFYFELTDGYDNRARVIESFMKFLDDPQANKLVMPGKCMLGGNVVGREGFNDGDEIFTSKIKSIEMVKRIEQGSFRNYLLCAITESHSRYYFYSNQLNAHMFLMLGDMANLGQLNRSRYYYIKRTLRNPKLI